MNGNSTTWGTSVSRKPWAGGAGAGLAGLGAVAASCARRLQQPPMLLWSLIAAAALLAFFVHLLNEQVLRGQQLREEQRAAATRPTPQASMLGQGGQHPVNLLGVTRQPMARP